MILDNQDGTKTFLHEAGDPANQAMVLLHGIGAEHNMWGPQLQVFAESGYRVLAPDMLGHGKSSRMTSITLLDWEHQISDLLAHKGLDTCILIGVSMGGVIAQSYAAHQPNKVSCLILSDTFGELKTWQEKALAHSQVIGFKLYRLLGARLLAKGMASAYKAPFAWRARQYFRQETLNADFTQLILARKAINRIDAIQTIDGNRIATLVMVGDRFGKAFIRANKKIADGINGSKFVVLERSMDPSNLVNPGAFNQEVLAFLGDHQHRPIRSQRRRA